jgi:hypothetical protein
VKEDVQELPAKVPSKRYQIEKLLDLHIAMWLASDTITARERARLEAEKERRKTLRPTVILTAVTCREGMTPRQRKKMAEITRAIKPTRLNRGFAHIEDTKELIKEATTVLVAPREMSDTRGSDAWELIRFARHRKLSVRVVTPDGKES